MGERADRTGPGRGRAARPTRARAGFSLVGVLVTTTIIAVALGSLSGSVLSSFRLNRTNEETAIAFEAARQMADRIQIGAFSGIFEDFNGTPAANFTVAGLTPSLEDGDGIVGEVLFPVSDAGALREDVDDANLGMPRDLDGDGEVDALDHGDDYILLPVTVRLRWRGVTGERVFELHRLLIQ